MLPQLQEEAQWGWVLEGVVPQAQGEEAHLLVVVPHPHLDLELLMPLSKQTIIGTVL